MPFIVCQRKKSRPRVSVEACRKCRKAASCEAYRRYREPFLFREMNRIAVGTKKRRVRSGREKRSPGPGSGKGPEGQTQEQTGLWQRPSRGASTCCRKGGG
jgi:hypothetical protein